MRRRLVIVVSALLLGTPAGALAQQPLALVDQTLAWRDRDTLAPAGPVLEVAEAHTAPVMGPGGQRFALGVSSPGEPGIPTTGRGRVGLWVVDAQRLQLQRQVRAGIAAEAVVFPGMIGAVLQDGALLVVDPDSGRIISRRQVGFSFGTPDGVHVAGRGVLVNEVRRGRGVEVVVVSASGRVQTRFVRLPGVRRTVALTAGDGRAYIVGHRRIAVLDPRTLRVSTRRFDGAGTSAAFADGALAVGGPRGLSLYDTTTWRALAQDDHSTHVFTSDGTFIASGDGRVKALTRDGRTEWSTAGNAVAVAAGRVYASPAVLDTLTGERVGTHPRTHTMLRVIDVTTPSR